VGCASVHRAPVSVSTFAPFCLCVTFFPKFCFSVFSIDLRDRETGDHTCRRREIRSEIGDRDMDKR
jgi:hypothetical protein